jgi:hypothetical protein
MLFFLKIFTLLFFPIFLWGLYSFLPNTYCVFSYEFPKIEKIETISFLLEENHRNTKQLQNLSSVVTEVQDVNKSIQIESNTSLEQLKITTEESNTTLQKEQHIVIDCNNSDANSSSILKILVIGDSMGEGLAYGLNSLKKQYPIQIKSLAKSSTTTHYWCSTHNFQTTIEKYKPNLILIALGTNEWNGVGSATKMRIHKIHNKFQEIGIQSVWITPPVKKATQFNTMVLDVYGDSAYDSSDLNVPRGSDKVHPTLKGYTTWAKDILSSINIGMY